MGIRPQTASAPRVHWVAAMLPLLLAAVIAQSPGVPQIFVPGAGYDAAQLRPEAGRAVLTSCRAPDSATVPLRLYGQSDAATLYVASPGCDAEILVAGAASLEPARVESARGEDAGTHALELQLGQNRSTLRSVPFSDGGVRVTLITAEGEELVLFEAASATADSALLWAGDLNADGALDLVLRSSEGFTTFQQLFLSDEAGLPALVSEVVLRD